MRSVSKRRWIGLFLAVIATVGSINLAHAQVNVKAALAAREEAKETLIPDANHLNDIVRVKVDADSPAGVTKVTFEIDDQFKAEVKKPPYVYDWDTLGENDGQHTIAVTAYNANGQTGVQRIKVVVENKLSLGIAHYTAQALLAYRKGDEVELRKAARKAFRINPGDPQAIRAMALSAGALGDVGRGFQLLDDRNNNIPPEDPITLEVRGFLFLVRGLKAPNIPAMLPDLQSGLTIARQRAAVQLRETLAAYPESKQDFASHLARGDSYFMASQNDPAIAAYEKAVTTAEGVPARRRAQHRLAVALLKAGREKEAETIVLRLVNGSEGNATSAAVLGAVLYRQRKYEAAREAQRAGMTQRNIAAMTVATLADLAQGTRTMAYKEAKELVTLSDMPEISYIAQATLSDSGDMASALRYFQMALVRAPLYTPILVSRAYEVMAYDKSEERFVHALNMFDLVLRQEPDNASAIAGRLAAYMQLKRYTAAQPLFQKLSSLEPTAPDLFIMMAANLDRDINKHTSSLEAMARARKLDPANYKDTIIPQMTDLIARMARLRRAIPLTPALLDRADMPSPTTAVEAKPAAQ